jgi:hypothetical protein
MSSKFLGVFEKLKRANENISNLESEIKSFFQNGEYAVLPEDNKELLLKAIEYHNKRVIPLRFSVLAGEIIHHLRSILDHVVWESSSEAYRQDFPRRIEFPIVQVRPVKKDDIAGYERKVNGITDCRILDVIDSLQPYNSTDPVDDPLLILHKMDVFDKHRELVLCASTGARELPLVPLPMIEDMLAGKQSRIFGGEAAQIAFKLKGHGKLIPQVSFSEFGRRPIQPVVSGLMQLNNYIVNAMKRFDP